MGYGSSWSGAGAVVASLLQVIGSFGEVDIDPSSSHAITFIKAGFSTAFIDMQGSTNNTVGLTIQSGSDTSFNAGMIIVNDGDVMLRSGDPGNINSNTLNMWLDMMTINTHIEAFPQGGLPGNTLQHNQEIWHPVTFQNLWSGSAQFRYMPNGNVQLGGNIVPGTRTGGTVIFNLPAGYRPNAIDAGSEYVCSWAGGGFWNKVAINSNGDVVYFDGSGGGTSGSLTGIEFSTI